VVKMKRKKEKESKGVRSAVRGKSKRVADSSPIPVSLIKDTGSSIEETLTELLKKVGLRMLRLRG